MGGTLEAADPSASDLLKRIPLLCSTMRSMAGGIRALPTLPPDEQPGSAALLADVCDALVGMHWGAE